MQYSWEKIDAEFDRIKLAAEQYVDEETGDPQPLKLEKSGKNMHGCIYGGEEAANNGIGTRKFLLFESKPKAGSKGPARYFKLHSEMEGVELSVNKWYCAVYDLVSDKKPGAKPASKSMNAEFDRNMYLLQWYQGGITRNKRVKKNGEKTKKKSSKDSKSPKKGSEKRERRTSVSSTRRKKRAKSVEEDDDAPKVAPPPPRPGRGKGPSVHAYLMHQKQYADIDECSDDDDDDEDESSAPQVPLRRGIGGKSFRRIVPVVEPEVIEKKDEEQADDDDAGEAGDDDVVEGNCDTRFDEYNQNEEELRKVDAVAAEMENDASEQEEPMDEECEEEDAEIEEPDHPFEVTCDPSHCGIPLQLIPQNGVAVQVIPYCNICPQCVSKQQVAVVDLSSRADLNSSYFIRTSAGVMYTGRGMRISSDTFGCPDYLSKVAEMRKFEASGGVLDFGAEDEDEDEDEDEAEGEEIKA